MNKRNKTIFFIGIGIVAAFVIVIIFFAVRFQKERQLDLKTGEQQISNEEYLACMQSVMYDTKMQIQKEYDADYDDTFWEKKYGNKYGYEILAENTLHSLKYIHAVYDLAKENGYVEDGSYEGLKKRLDEENNSRKEKLANNEVIYGLKEYSYDLYLQYEMSSIKEQYCNDKTREGMNLTEEEIVEHYNSRDWIFGEEAEKADLETARVAIIRELREEKYDAIIEQRVENSQVSGDREAMNQFTLKNI